MSAVDLKSVGSFGWYPSSGPRSLKTIGSFGWYGLAAATTRVFRVWLKATTEIVREIFASTAVEMDE